MTTSRSRCPNLLSRSMIAAVTFLRALVVPLVPNTSEVLHIRVHGLRPPPTKNLITKKSSQLTESNLYTSLYPLHFDADISNSYSQLPGTDREIHLVVCCHYISYLLQSPVQMLSIWPLLHLADWTSSTSRPASACDQCLHRFSGLDRYTTIQNEDLETKQVTKIEFKLTSQTCY